MRTNLNTLRRRPVSGAFAVGVSLVLAVSGCSDDSSSDGSTTSSTAAAATIPDGSFEAEPRVDAPSDGNPQGGFECTATGTVGGAVTAELDEVYSVAFDVSDTQKMVTFAVPEINFTIEKNGDSLRVQAGTSNSAWFGSEETVELTGEFAEGKSLKLTGSIADATSENPVDVDVTIQC